MRLWQPLKNNSCGISILLDLLIKHRNLQICMPNLTPQPDQTVSILLLCEDEKASNLDRRSLRLAGYGHVRTMTSGIEAAKLLAGMDKPLDGYFPDIIVCLNQLSDMDGEQFCAIVRQHPRLISIPILLIMPNDNEAEQLRTLGCGASTILARPYSVDALRTMLANLAKTIPMRKKLQRAPDDADTRAFDEALATYGVLLRSERKSEDYFKVGMRCLTENRWSMAIAAFECALHDEQIRAEAELGMAAAYKGKNDIGRFKIWLARAAESFLQAKRWDRARSAYARLLQNDSSAKSPFLTEAHKLIHEGNYDEASKMLVYSLGFISKKMAGERYARVCMAAEDPEKMLEALKRTLKREGKGKYDFLGEEVDQHLEIMTRQKRERQLRNAAERKWQLAQNLGLLEKTQETLKTDIKNKHFGSQTPELREDKPQVAAFGKEMRVVDKSRISLADTDLDEESEKQYKEYDNADTQVLAPFDKKLPKDDLFTKKSKLHELFSVMRLTWRLSRDSSKN